MNVFPDAFHVPRNINVVPADTWPNPDKAPPPISLMRDPAVTGPQQSYAVLHEYHPVDLEEPRHVLHWGQRLKAVVYPQLGPFTYEAPHPNEAQWVDIDRLRLDVVRRYLERDDGVTNLVHSPYRHDPHLIEGLQDEVYLYLIKPLSNLD